MSLPTEMNALVLETFGPPNHLKYTKVPLPQLTKPTEVLVRIEAIGINPVEAKARQGNIPQILVRRPCILGADYSGVIVAKGSSVTKFEINDAVFGTLLHPLGPKGTYADYVIVNTTQDTSIAKKPANVSFEDAAALGIAALTALQATVVCHPQPPKKVLVIGASGGVGMYGVQMAKARGAYVVGVCSGKNKSLVLDTYGADRVIDYNNPQAFDQEEADSYDIVFDLVGGKDYYQKCNPLVKPKTGIFVSAVGPTEHFGAKPVGYFEAISVGATTLYRKFFACRRYSLIIGLPHGRLDAELVPWLEKNLIRPNVPKENVFDLKDAAKAHEIIDSHRTTGKIVLRPNHQ